MNERIEIDGLPPRDELEVWQRWLRRHGVDPNNVLATRGWIERDVERYRLAWLGLERDEHGRVVVVEVPQYVQLEGPPLPFPESTWNAVR